MNGNGIEGVKERGKGEYMGRGGSSGPENKISVGVPQDPHEVRLPGVRETTEEAED